MLSTKNGLDPVVAGAGADLDLIAAMGAQAFVMIAAQSRAESARRSLKSCFIELSLKEMWAFASDRNYTISRMMSPFDPVTAIGGISGSTTQPALLS